MLSRADLCCPIRSTEARNATLDPAVAPDDGTVVARPKVGIRFEGWEVICPGGVDPRASYAKRGALFRLHLPMRHGEANGRVAEGAVKGGVQSTAKTWQQ
ncbi:MAG: hypothetical protein A2Z37_05340 [Chloroflexi bacterium RBG_19FT_COMBO_62_14]|nr:MAG: hypothetical protein A2Z37_05340 [Chloroflexi bacterium RBG_19FT_COMBO_62_14]